MKRLLPSLVAHAGCFAMASTLGQPDTSSNADAVPQQTAVQEKTWEERVPHLRAGRRADPLPQFQPLYDSEYIPAGEKQRILMIRIMAPAWWTAA